MSPAPGWVAWFAAAVLAGGAILTTSVVTQPAMALRAPLAAAVPTRVDALVGEDVALSDLERQVAGVTDYVMRVYERDPNAVQAGAPWASVYVGYYDSQTRGKTIHSPKNCMPGAGWEALESRPELVPVPGGVVEVNRYRLVNEEQQVLVLYWYQGRGRVVASEYRAKWDLLRDAAIARRSDEALVRIVVPVLGSEEEALELARKIASELVPSLTTALPIA